MIRRTFIKQAGVLAGGMLFQSQLAEAFAPAADGELVNVGIIGCGDRGKGILHMMKQFPSKFRAVAVSDLLDFRMKEAEGLKVNPKLKLYKDYRKLLDDRQVQAVIIAVPLHLHFQVAADALAAGKHTYLEKTMTYDIPQALELVSIAKTHPRLVLQVGHQYRYTPLYFRVKELIEEGALGKVVQIECRWDRNGNWRRPVPSKELERQINWRMYKEYSGGLAAELLSHQIDFINWAFNTHPDQVQGTGGIDFFKDGRETFDNVQAVLRYSEAGMIGNFGATCANAHDGFLFRIKGNKGTISLLVDQGVYYPEKGMLKELETVDGVTGATKIAFNKDGGIPILKEPTKDGTYYALDDFYKCISEGSQPASNVLTGAKTAISVHLANQAMDTGSIQLWKPSFNFS